MRTVSNNGVPYVRVTLDELPDGIPGSWVTLTSETDLPPSIAAGWEAHLTGRYEITIVSPQMAPLGCIRFPSAHQEDFLLALRRWGYISILLCEYKQGAWTDASAGVRILGRDIRGS